MHQRIIDGGDWLMGGRDLEPEEGVSFTLWCPWSLTLHPGAEIVSEEPSGRREVVDTMGPQVDKYGRIWWSWWVSLQPSWREGETLCNGIPMDMEWSQLMEGGPLGIALIIMMLAWWLVAEGDNTKAFANSRLATPLLM